MNKAPLPLSSSIRTVCAERLTRTISIPRMHNSLIDLFVDRTAIDTSLLGRMKSNYDKWQVYNDCLHLNDKNTIDFNNRLPQSNDIIDENTGNYIPSNIDLNNNVFIPFENGDNI